MNLFVCKTHILMAQPSSSSEIVRNFRVSPQFFYYDALILFDHFNVFCKMFKQP